MGQVGVVGLGGRGNGAPSGSRVAERDPFVGGAKTLFGELVWHRWVTYLCSLDAQKAMQPATNVH